MQFSLIPALALVATVMATPIADDMSPRAVTSINESEVFAFETPASCSILSCITVISEAVCITEAIEASDYSGILKCANKKQLCSCAGCYKKLGNFLEKWGIC
ncbi:hypothetical protein B0T22DRAFT_441219 [Podospora appendiculata]|uniref:Fungal calcium binding protein domain-containing protein n=1 Tax=Podospora appendiculata TaxID=314037 RepID=A0AAE0XBQ7_9PEZI|nr:hypothetical protein B0T22DRAFT_441219 [Podospora appendiculata]